MIVRDAAVIDDLLAKTSRTFALSIPLLPEPTREEVALGYLLFRIADTFEDAVGWPRQRRLDALAGLSHLLRDPDPAQVDARASAWLAAPPPIPHAGYQQLLAEAPRVLASYGALAEAPRGVIRGHLHRTLEGMARFVGRGDGAGRLALASLADLRDYCYAVAGIVGEMLTDLFLLNARGLAPVAERLRARAAQFGEGLQLVNILKDAGADSREGRSYLPAGVPREVLFDLAHGDLEEAADYVRALQEAAAPRGLVAFTALPVLLARASLALVQADGPGAKLSRQQVRATVSALDAALDRGAPAL